MTESSAASVVGRPGSERDIACDPAELVRQAGNLPHACAKVRGVLFRCWQNRTTSRFARPFARWPQESRISTGRGGSVGQYHVAHVFLSFDQADALLAHATPVPLGVPHPEGQSVISGVARPCRGTPPLRPLPALPPATPTCWAPGTSDRGASGGTATNAGVFIPVADLPGVTAAELSGGTAAQQIANAVFGILKQVYNTISPSSFAALGITVANSEAKPSGGITTRTYSLTGQYIADIEAQSVGLDLFRGVELIAV